MCVSVGVLCLKNPPPPSPGQKPPFGSTETTTGTETTPAPKGGSTGPPVFETERSKATPSHYFQSDGYPTRSVEPVN